MHDTSTPSPSVCGTAVLVFDADADMAFFLVLVLETDTALGFLVVDVARGVFVAVLFPSHEANPAIVLG